MLEILRGTPLWVYAVFLLVTYYGIAACFKNYESKRSLKITPTIFISLSLASMTFAQGFAIALSIFAMGVLTGWYLARWLYSYNGIQREGERLVLGGSVKTLAVYWCFFAWRYYCGYQVAAHPELASETIVIALSSLASGLINGLVLGRSIRLLRFFDESSVRQA